MLHGDMMKRDRHWNVFVILLVVLLVSISLNGVVVESAATRTLKLGYYANTTCKNVETVVRNEVLARSRTDPTVIPTLLRIYFHDCFADVSSMGMNPDTGFLARLECAFLNFRAYSNNPCLDFIAASM